MFQAYSLNKEVAANSIISFDNIAVDKGGCEQLTGVGTIKLNKCGAYLVSVDGSSDASATIQLSRNGVPMPQAQSTGNSVGFTTIVQVERNNCPCNPCTAPVTIQLLSLTASTYSNINIVVCKMP